jgi:cyclopropane fatty-acyl-phospholipid synthase-like methyltransferase
MNNKMKPFSESCERNRAPILEVLSKVFADRHVVLEIGSGTGQHAVHFAKAMPHLLWQTSDLEEQHEGIMSWLLEARLRNVLPPLDLDVSDADWPVVSVDAVFTANTLHIVSWPEVERFFEGVGRVLEPDGVLAVYGPFNYNGQYTSESNARFDKWLKERDPKSGIRDFEAVDELARGAGLGLVSDHAMPANNRCLVWRKA